MTKWYRRPALLIIALFIGAAHTVIWLLACSQLQAGWEQWAARNRDLGWTVTSGPIRRAGWPWAAGLDVTAPAVSGGGDGPGGIAWSAPLTELRLTALHPATLAITAVGRQTLRLGGLGEIGFEAQPFVVTVALDGTVPLELTTSGLEVWLPWGRLLVRTAVVQATNVAATLVAHDVSVPDAGAWAGAETLSLRAVLTQPIPTAATPMAQAEAWRRAGGTVEIPEFHVSRQALGVTGHSVVRLDAQLQPELDGTAEVTGYSAALDDLVRAGVLPSRSAMAVRAVLDLIAAPGGGRTVRLPVQVRDGLLVIARFPLARVPMLVWGVP